MDEIKRSLDRFYAVYDELMAEGLTGGTRTDLRRILRMLDYFTAQCTHTYRTKLLNLLWIADQRHYEKHGKTISGLAYVKGPTGAFPKCSNHLYNFMLSKIPSKANDRGYRQFYEPRPCDNSCFSAEEIATMADVAEIYGTCNSSATTSYIKNQDIYKNTPPGRYINFNSNNFNSNRG